jgi:hypothetical protein
MNKRSPYPIVDYIFAGDHITLVIYKNHPYCNIPQICRNIGLKFHEQVHYINIEENLKSAFVYLDIGTSHDVPCLPLLETYGWLMRLNIDTNLRDVRHDKIRIYKQRFYRELDIFWHTHQHPELERSQPESLEIQQQIESLNQKTQSLDTLTQGLVKLHWQHYHEVQTNTNDLRLLQEHLNLLIPIRVGYFNGSNIRLFGIQGAPTLLAYDFLLACDYVEPEHADWQRVRSVLTRLGFIKEKHFIGQSVRELATQYHVTFDYFCRKAQFHNDILEYYPNIRTMVLLTKESYNHICELHQEFGTWFLYFTHWFSIIK